MKVAICLSGQPRFVDQGVENIIKNLLEPNEFPDVFIHTWRAERFTSAQPDKENKWRWNPDTVEILNSLNPKAILIQEQEEFKNMEDLENLPTAIQTRLSSMFYSAQFANQLKAEYELLRDFKYDLVIKTRIDINYHKPIVLDNLNIDLGAVNVAAMHQHMRIGDSYPISDGGNYSSVSDTWVASSSHNMDCMSKIYNNFRYIHSQIKPYQYGECYIGFQRYLNKLPINMVDVPYNLYR